MTLWNQYRVSEKNEHYDLLRRKVQHTEGGVVLPITFWISSGVQSVTDTTLLQSHEHLEPIARHEVTQTDPGWFRTIAESIWIWF